MSFKRIYSQYHQLKDAGDILLPRFLSGVIGVDGLEVGSNLKKKIIA